MRPEETIKHSNQNGSRFILVGEDDIDDEEFMTEAFKSVDPSVYLVFINNGRQVVKYLEELGGHHLPCLILIDYNMPELNGAEVLKELQSNARFKQVPKIIWSTSASDTYKQMCIEAGADDYIIKPSNVKDLTEIVRHLISLCSV